MSNKKKVNTTNKTAEPITHVPILKSCKPIPDGSFIESNDKHDGFASINTPRYGVEVDVDDI